MPAKAFILMLCTGTLCWGTAAYCAPADWFLLDENPGSGFFYDRNGIMPVREGVIQVRARVLYSEEGKKEALKVLKGLPQQAPLYETIYNYEINCPEREGHLLASSHLDKGGTILKTTELSAVTQWEYLPPDTRLGLVVQQACPR